MSLAKLTSLSTQTLSLLLERQRLQSLPSSSPQPPSSKSLKSRTNAKKIHDNLQTLRTGILELESKLGGGPTNASKNEKEAVRLLKSQFERMRGMFDSEDGEGLGVIEGFDDKEQPDKLEPESQQAEEGSAGAIPKGGIEDFMTNGSIAQTGNGGGFSTFKPYKDDPHEGEHDEQDGDGGHESVLEQQRLLMEEQDTHLTHLSNSISRQHHLSIQINTELDTQTGLLEELDTDLDNTGSRLSGARKALGRFERGVKGNVSTFSIAILIVVLLILIIVFKT